MDLAGHVIERDIICHPRQAQGTGTPTLHYMYHGVPAGVDITTLSAPPLPPNFAANDIANQSPGMYWKGPNNSLVRVSNGPNTPAVIMPDGHRRGGPISAVERRREIIRQWGLMHGANTPYDP